MKVLVCGSRNFNRLPVIRDVLNRYFDRALPNIVEVIHGAASGADSMTASYAKRMGLKVNAFPANWAEFGKAAGFIRNKQMLGQKPDLVIAFVRDPNNSPGTANMVLQALCAGVKVEVHTYDG